MMEKKEFIDLLNRIFVPLGFKRKGNNWVYNGEALTKLINLQKSNFGETYYLNYGYIIKNLDLDGMRSHISKGLGSSNKLVNSRIHELLDLDSLLDQDSRLRELEDLINKQIVEEFNHINSEEDILNYITGLSNMNRIPGIVLRHFNL